MEDIIRKFLDIDCNNGSGSGFGSGSGSCSGSGSGFGSGSGSGYGSGFGSGFGSGSGSGSCSGSGSGSGYGSGSGSCSGSGTGFSDGSGISMVNGMVIYNIDNVPTLITRIIQNIAKGFVLNDDLTLLKCFIAKDNDLFAHGETLKEAVRALQVKKLECLNVDETIEKFFQEFEKDKKYKASVFYDWHHYLTGSCEMGRKSFADNHGIDLENDYFTVNEFIKLTINDYGGEVIEKLKRAWENGN